MVKPIQVRGPEEWRQEMQRLSRISAAARIDLLHGEDWRRVVTTLADTLALLVVVRPELEEPAIAHALEVAARLGAEPDKKRRRVGGGRVRGI